LYQDEKVCKPWLTIEPPYGIVPPNESITISFTVDVTSVAAAALNSGQDNLEDIIIVRLEHGRDYFVTVTGDYKKSCFGNSLEFLNAVHITHPTNI
jgi:phosphatidylinositol-bisphosphatase